MATPETSIIIRTFNEEKHLPGLLEGISGQDYRDFEMVVVDSGSVDRTRDIAGRHADKLLRINSHDFTYGYSLNVGLEASSGSFATIVSAHRLAVDDKWLGALIAPLREDNVAMAYGRQMGLEASSFGESQDLRRTFGSQRQVLKPPNFFANNANSAVLRELWRQHPFDESLPGLEDVEWAKYWMERGYDVVYEPQASLHHIHEETWPQVRRRHFREAAAARQIGTMGRGRVIPEVVKQGRNLVA